MPSQGVLNAKNEEVYWTKQHLLLPVLLALKLVIAFR